MTLRLTGIRGSMLQNFLALIQDVSKQLFTAADGETYAVGRFLAIVLMLFGMTAPSALAGWLMFNKKTDMADWVSFISAMTLYIPALSGAAVALITLTSGTEPKVPPQQPKGDDLPAP